MEVLRWKTRISVLWIWMAVAMSAHSLLFLFETGAIEKVISGEMAMGPGMLLLSSLFWLVPLVMAFLSLNLKDLANRWANMILGIVFTVFNVFHLIEHLAEPSVHQILIIGSTVVATALIFWYALRWPKQEV